MARARRGTGSIYCSNKKTKALTIKWYVDGRPFTQSTGTADKRIAENILKTRIREAESGLMPQSKKVMVADLVASYVTSLKVDRVDYAPKAEERWRVHLASAFGKVQAARLTTDMLRTYVAKRQREEIVVRSTLKSGEIQESTTGKFPTNATINRELSVIRAAYNLARKEGKIVFAPAFPMLSESGNVRKGFLNDEQYSRLAEEALKEGLWLRGIVGVLTTYGWRKSEALEYLRVGQVDMSTGSIRLNDSKNGDGRLVFMTNEVKPLIAACIVGKRPDEYVFTRDGQPVGDFRKTWQQVCVRAGLGEMIEVETLKHPKYVGRLVHDLRRTGVRNLRRSGVQESEAMKVSGHRTASVFKRYDIIDEADMREVTRKLNEQNENRSNLGRNALEMVYKEKSETIQ
ncbi:MAG: tyrosine-type recombinase/integrase [Acidobacteriota bacterium]|nr:tyrosine-type recombinase/integrase [Acidobacteriota bacterium]